MTPMPAGPRPASAPDFLLAGPRHSLALAGVLRALPRGGVATLAGRAADFFDAGHNGPRLLAGAVPYDREAPDFLFQPAAELPLAFPAPGPGRTASTRIVADPPAARYREAVAQAVRRIGQGEFEKIVLSRSLRLVASAPHDEAALLAMMRRDSRATVFSVPLPPRQGAGRRRLVGATPELLVERRGRRVLSHPLAGSARRSADPALDRRAGAALMASAKDRREHEIAAEMVLDTLAPWCDRLAAPEGMALTSTAQMWHLGTRIEGRLRDSGTSCAELLAALHPTPAVCGLPRDAADAALAGLEGYDRGFYAGAVGWLDASGDGCWYLALRCAEIAGTEARLYAGAGIVASSDPAAEEAETSAKFRTMLSAFGLDEQGDALHAAE